MKRIIKKLLLSDACCACYLYLLAVFLIIGLFAGFIVGLGTLAKKASCPYPNIASRVIITYPLVCEFLEYRGKNKLTK